MVIDKLVDHMLNLQMPDGETFCLNRLYIGLYESLQSSTLMIERRKDIDL